MVTLSSELTLVCLSRVSKNVYAWADASLAPIVITPVAFCVRPPSKPVKARFARPFSLLCVPMTSSVPLTKEVHSRRARIVIVESIPSSIASTNLDGEAFPASRYVPSLHRQQTTHVISTVDSNAPMASLWSVMALVLHSRTSESANALTETSSACII
jgi:hypothetical protein